MSLTSPNTEGSNVATVDASLKSASDLIADQTMMEIARRLIVTFEEASENNVIFSPTEPTDHTKTWWQIDPTTNLPIGTPKYWDDAQGKWVPTNTDQVQYTPPPSRYISNFVAAGASTVNFEFLDIQTTNYSVTLTPTLYIAGTWVAAPGSLPSGNGYLIANKTNTLVTVNFYGMPTGGVQWEMDIEARV